MNRALAGWRDPMNARAAQRKTRTHLAFAIDRQGPTFYTPGIVRFAICIVLLVASSAWAQSSPRLAVTAAGTRVSLSPDGPWLSRGTKANEILQIKDDTGSRPQFRVHFQGFKLVLYADRAALRDSVGDATWLYPALVPDLATDDSRTDLSPGIMVSPGEYPRIVRRDKNGMLQVKLVLERIGFNLAVTGYLRASSVVKVYDPHGRYPQMPFAPDVTLPERFKLLATPAGEVFASSTNRERINAMVLQRDKKYSLVRVDEIANGWIATAQLKPMEPVVTNGLDDVDLGDLGVEGGTEDSEWPPPPPPPPPPRSSKGVVRTRPSIATGAPLFDAIDGHKIGLVASWFMYQPSRRENNWCRFDVPTRFGSIALWSDACGPDPADTQVRSP
jgi:hypothetical protein